MGEMLILRHGQSTWNAEDRWQGHADPPLTPEGRESARRLADQLAGMAFDVIVSSDLRRSRDTAEIIAAELGLPGPHAFAGLRERDTGLWTGMLGPEIDEQWPGWRARWKEEELVELPGGEHRDAFDRRMLGALVEVGTRFAGQRVLVVGHAGTLRALERHCGFPTRRQNLDGVWVAVEDGSLRCVRSADLTGEPGPR